MLLSLALYIILLFINTYCSLSCFGFISWRSFPSLVFPAQRSSFCNCCKAGFVVLNYFNFCLSGKFLISPSNLNENLTGQNILRCSFFTFTTLNIRCHFLLVCRVSVEKSADRQANEFPAYSSFSGVPSHRGKFVPEEGALGSRCVTEVSGPAGPGTRPLSGTTPLHKVPTTSCLFSPHLTPS